MSVQHSYENISPFTRSATYGASVGLASTSGAGIGDSEIQPCVSGAAASRGAIRRAKLHEQAARAAAKVSADGALKLAADALIAFLPEYDRLARVHNTAEEAEAARPGNRRLRAAERRTERAYSRGLEQLRRCGLAVLKAPAHTSEEVMLKLMLYAASTGSDTLDPMQIPFESDLKPALASAIRDLKGLVGEPSKRVEWLQAKLTYERAKTACERNSEAIHSASEHLVDAAPLECRETGVRGRLDERWRTKGCFEQDKSLTREQRDRLRPVVLDWLERRKSHPAYLEQMRLDEEGEGLFDRLECAEEHLMRTDAPNIEAALFKSTLAGRSLDDGGRGYDDVARVAQLQNSFREDAYPVHLHRDLLRLAGKHHPMLDVDFYPRRWIAKFEEAGGHLSCPGGEGLYWSVPRGDGEGPKRQQAMLAELHADDGWRMKAVFIEAEARLRRGGDPMYDHRGEPRTSPRT